MSATTLLLSLYPAVWRRRYGDEFAAVLESQPIGPFDALDVVRGAIDAHRRLGDQRTDPTPSLEPRTSDQVGGGAAIIGGVLLLLGGSWSVADPAASDPGAAVLFAALVALVYGLAGLSAFQARAHPRLIWSAFLVPAVGAVLTIGGMVLAGVADDRRWIGDLAGWHFAMLGLFLTVIGHAIFALATLWTGVLDRRSAMLLALSATVVMLAFGGHALFAIRLDAMLYVGTVGYAAGWMGLGRAALATKRAETAG
jgi:hypothetical protein